MKTVDQIYNESVEKIQSVAAITEVSNKIQEITNALYQGELKDWNGDRISRAIASLAVLRVNLGREMTDAVAYFDISYLHRKISYANEWKPTKAELNAKMTKATVQDVDSEVMIKIAEEYENELKNKHYAEQLRILYDSTETLITALQSRLGVLKAEQYEMRSANNVSHHG
jgi:hypothetical protein